MSADRDSPLRPLLQVDGLEHRFGRRVVLDGLSFELAEGAATALLGPNGSGKSTAFAVLAGLLPRQGGRVVFRGREIDAPDRQLRSELGVVFQSPAVDPKLPAAANLQLAARLHALPKAEGRRRAGELLAAAGLAERAEDLVKTFSGGMTRRLDLARALLPEPSLLLMDEPTSGLDEAAFRETWERIEGLRRERSLSLLVATHRPEEAEGCDRVGILAGGRLVALDSPAALRERLAEDVVELAGDDAEALAASVRESFGVDAMVRGDEVVVPCSRGHELVPRLVESLPAGRLRSVSLRRPSLADVFLDVTGRALGQDEDAAPARDERDGEAA